MNPIQNNDTSCLGMFIILGFHCLIVLWMRCSQIIEISDLMFSFIITSFSHHYHYTRDSWLATQLKCLLCFALLMWCIKRFIIHSKYSILSEISTLEILPWVTCSTGKAFASWNGYNLCNRHIMRKLTIHPHSTRLLYLTFWQKSVVIYSKCILLCECYINIAFP